MRRLSHVSGTRIVAIKCYISPQKLLGAEPFHIGTSYRRNRSSLHWRFLLKAVYTAYKSCGDRKRKEGEKKERRIQKFNMLPGEGRRKKPFSF